MLNAKIIVPNKTNGVALGNLHNPVVLLAVIGILITLVLVIREVLGGIFIGMVITTIIGIIFGVIAISHSIVGETSQFAAAFCAKTFQAIRRFFDTNDSGNPNLLFCGNFLYCWNSYGSCYSRRFDR
ncbi:hypothetical protein FC19_GL001168 [Liquorilactobacillus aquaticus DSM 21051]|uniref:Uncharacterized protein n=1 Tax=Liquorilactobacillus aquaticus DSM 21051 TaxID=1423725 RepID=A0A0R2CXT8_9LACO|nr:hypothetical protein [Liquorilactobacillus aquaticus]KRM96098.1 hypothetical protein FC19_GL001168 [Liquorilactobacillus aquaticus DSM 21051]